MKKLFKGTIIGCLMMLLAVPVMFVKAEVTPDENGVATVTTYADLKEAVGNSQVTTIKLGANIEDISETIYVDRVLTIDGQSTYTLKGLGDSMTLAGGVDGSIITVTKEGNLTISNVTITDAKKYGLQAYDGGKITVSNVTIENCKFGAILVNGGSLTVQSLTMSDNGEHEGGNGIEIGKGENVTEIPSVTLDGTIEVTGENQDSYIYVAEDDELDKFEVKNSESTEDEFKIKDGKIVITNSEGEIKFESNEIGEEITAEGEEYTEPVVKEEQVTPEEPEIEAPNTVDNVSLYLVLGFISIIGLVAITYSFKRKFEN